MSDLIKKLNQQVANLGVLYIKLHSHHWFVSGTQFKQLHELFEEYYDGVTEDLDEVAERILQLDAAPLFTLKDFLANSSLKEATGKETSKEMIESILNDFVQLNKEFSDVIETAQDLGDEVTADIFIGMQAKYQKNIWMLKASSK